MLRNEDIEVGVTRGLITQAQADGLWQISRERHTARRFAGADDERFRFIGGFNDVFLALGVTLFAFGLTLLPAAFVGTSSSGNPLTTVLTLVGPLIALWALAEFLTRKRRLILPSIVLAIAICWTGGFVLSSFATVPFRASGMSESEIANAVGSVSPMFLAAMLVAIAFYLRFKLPFALLIAAASLVIATINFLSNVVAPDIAPHVILPAILCLGIAIFALAMTYDISDPQRLTRRSDCAFWLHILAAPLIVHSLVKSLATTVPATATEFRNPKIFDLLFTTITFDTWTVTIILTVFVAMSLLALIIDRRALLVSTLIYIGTMIGYFISTINADTSGVAASTFSPIAFGIPLLAIGALVIFLGTTWTPLRTRIVATMPLSAIRNSIPPIREANT